MQKPIILIGLMGCGKTSIGKRLAPKLKLGFIDLDHKIEESAGMPISQIFSQYGEKYFRDLELKTLKESLTNKPIVISTGGGAFINDEIRSLIKEKALSIWIKADLETLLERVSRKNTRPLLEHGDKKQILQDLMNKRYPIYQEADIIVETSRGAHEIVLKRIIEALNHAKK